MEQNFIHNLEYGSAVDVNNFREDKSLKTVSEVDLAGFQRGMRRKERIFVR